MPANPHTADPWDLWTAAAGNESVDAALLDLFQRLDADIAARRPTCWLSGKCCRFDTYGHRLYATGLEIAWLIQRLDPVARRRLHDADLPAMDGCPFQIDRLCSVHALRPIGCRIYFCDPTAQAWQAAVYESHLAAVKKLHERHDLPYCYMEWRAALDEARRAAAAR